MLEVSEMPTQLSSTLQLLSQKSVTAMAGVRTLNLVAKQPSRDLRILSPLPSTHHSTRNTGGINLRQKNKHVKG